MLFIIQWMEQTDSYPEIILAIHSYLIYRGRVQMKRICNNTTILAQFATEKDRLGWRNFMEAKITKTLFDVQEDWLQRLNSQKTIESWTKQFLTKLLNITHRQWLYRNSRIHIKYVEGLSLADHEKIM